MARGGKRWNPHGDSNPAWKGGDIADPIWFRQKYVVENLSLRAVAKSAGRSLRTAARWREKHGIPSRGAGVKTRQQRGAECYNWTGGLQKSDPAAYQRDWAAHNHDKVYDLCECGSEKRRESKRCLRCDHSGRPKGSDNPNWRGGASTLMARIRAHCKEWRQTVFERDGYACRSCGDDKGGNLRAHHIEPLAALVCEILNGDLTNTDGSYERVTGDHQVNDPDNGVTLCDSCHKVEHEAGSAAWKAIKESRRKNGWKRGM